MKYAVIKIVNGNYAVQSEHGTFQSAVLNYHNLCAALWNAADAYEAVIAIFDDKLKIVAGYKEIITHERPIEE